jgi:hypothetical protein
MDERENLGGKRSKDSLADFPSSWFILGVENVMVKFDYDTTPTRWACSRRYLSRAIGAVRRRNA